MGGLMDELLAQARTEYARMLGLHFDTAERAYGQRYMAFLRDFIAHATGKTAEQVQTEFEAQHQWRPFKTLSYPPDGKWTA
jgi:hypothetical protein